MSKRTPTIVTTAAEIYAARSQDGSYIAWVSADGGARHTQSREGAVIVTKSVYLGGMVEIAYRTFRNGDKWQAHSAPLCALVTRPVQGAKWHLRDTAKPFATVALHRTFVSADAEARALCLAEDAERRDRTARFGIVS